MPGVPFISQPGVDVWHVVSEQARMKYCAEWLKGFVTEVPIEFIAAAEPFWRP